VYCFLKHDAATAVDILRVEDVEHAVEALEAAGVTLLHSSEIYEPDAV